MSELCDARRALVLIDAPWNRGSRIYVRGVAWVSHGMVHVVGRRQLSVADSGLVGPELRRSWPTRRCEVRWLEPDRDLLERSAA